MITSDPLLVTPVIDGLAGRPGLANPTECPMAPAGAE
ncbi:unannotated protein [freshwater metagenome]|uniref:Unannotated protein n=1 Tax=freshwater metagenome TaxID=449393 RepID=A0A6J5YUX4_9ZZZZ